MWVILQKQRYLLSCLHKCHSMIAVFREELKKRKNRRPGTEAFQQLYCVVESTIEGVPNKWSRKTRQKPSA